MLSMRLGVPETSLQVIQPIQEALLSKIVDLNDSAADASSMITVRTERLPIDLEDAISVMRSLEQGTASSEDSMPIMDVESMVKKALLAIQGQTASAPSGRVSESALKSPFEDFVRSVSEGNREDSTA